MSYGETSLALSMIYVISIVRGAHPVARCHWFIIVSLQVSQYARKVICFNTITKGQLVYLPFFKWSSQTSVVFFFICRKFTEKRAWISNHIYLYFAGCTFPLMPSRMSMSVNRRWCGGMGELLYPKLFSVDKLRYPCPKPGNMIQHLHAACHRTVTTR